MMHCIISLYMIFLTDSSGDSHHLCLASYRFPEGHVPKALAHGNSKTGAPFYPTWPSTMKKLKSECRERGPKDTVSRVSSVMGGMVLVLPEGSLEMNIKSLIFVIPRKGFPAAQVEQMMSFMLSCHDASVQMLQANLLEM